MKKNGGYKVANPKPNFDGFVKGDKSSMAFYLFLASGYLAIGAGLMAVGFFGPGETNEKLFQLAGAVVGAIAGFPLKNFDASRKRILTAREIETRWDQIMAAPNVSKREIENLNQLVWDLYKARGGIPV